MNNKPVDIAALNELRSIMSDDFDLLIQVFISDSEERIKALEQAINLKDAEALRGAAHSFKGSCLNISAADLTELCRQLEFMGRDNELANAEEVYAKTKIEFEKVRDFLVNQ